MSFFLHQLEIDINVSVLNETWFFFSHTEKIPGYVNPID